MNFRCRRITTAAVALLVVLTATRTYGSVVAFTPSQSLSLSSCGRSKRVQHRRSAAVKLPLRKQKDGWLQNSTGTHNGTSVATFRPFSAIRQRMRRYAITGNGNRKMLRQHAYVLLAGLCLSLNAGYINGCCLSGLLNSGGVGVGVSAFTGTYTNAGLQLGAGNLAAFGSHGKMILCFIGGSFLSGIINPRPVAHRMSPRYGPSFLVGSVLLAVSSVLANIRPEGRAFLYFAAAASGLQNAMSSAYSANLIRSTHMTGITSDIGMILGQMIRGNLENAWRFIVLSGLATSFLLGGAVSYLAVTRFQSLALVFNACFFFAIAIGIISFTAYEQHVSLWRAASGQWDWKGDPPSEELLTKIFKRHDVDGNGYLSEDEFKKVLTEAGMKKMSDVGIRAIFRSVDTKRDGVITQEEMLDLVTCDPDGECEIAYGGSSVSTVVP